ncbi:DUF3173 domain-containing protein [Streptococcus sp. 1643]|jgi:hypothetical protein|nr:DUF3173 family protein [Streptococcus sp. Marseille-Q6470]QCZ57626.1 DUF3173 domain-containing protein [Streptococcus sp. 1643]
MQFKQTTKQNRLSNSNTTTFALVNKIDVMNMTGYSESQSKKIIKQAKLILVNKGFQWYKNKRVGRVPMKIVEDILGFELNLKNDIMYNVHEDTANREETQYGSN